MTKTQLFRRMAVIAIGGAVVACGMIAGIDDFRLGECKGGKCERDAEPEPVPQDDNDATVPVADTGVPCVGKSNPPAIRVGTPPSTFCIDTNEVSNGDYKKFLEDKVDINTQPALCLPWNQSFAPARPGVDLDAGAEAQAPVIPDNLPVTDVDWCDAYAYCKWAGKYLCAAVDDAGKRAGPVNDESLSNFKANQWLLACSAEARLRYPYGGTFDGTRCNVANLGEGGVVPVSSLPGCIGGYEGLHDMVGNAWEWFDGPCATDGGLKPDAAEGAQGDSCILKGASFLDNGVEFDCAYNQTRVRRDFHGRNVGFRCCSD